MAEAIGRTPEWATTAFAVAAHSGRAVVLLASSLQQAVGRGVAVVDLVAGVVLELDAPGAVFLCGGRGLRDQRGAVADLDGGHGRDAGLDDDVRTHRGLGQRERALTVDVERRDLLADRRHV